MDKILLLAHTEDDGSLPKAAYESLNAALKLAADLGGADVTIGLIGGNVQSAADSLASCGATGIFAVSGEDFAASRYSSDPRWRCVLRTFRRMRIGLRQSPPIRSSRWTAVSMSRSGRRPPSPPDFISSNPRRASLPVRIRR